MPILDHWYTLKEKLLCSWRGHRYGEELPVPGLVVCQRCRLVGRI